VIAHKQTTKREVGPETLFGPKTQKRHPNFSNSRKNQNKVFFIFNILQLFSKKHSKMFFPLTLKVIYPFQASQTRHGATSTAKQ
jgi:hypothetical protein